MIGRRGERGSGISVLAARHDDDDDDIPINLLFFKKCLLTLLISRRSIEVYSSA